jgi:hypothetical protein
MAVTGNNFSVTSNLFGCGPDEIPSICGLSNWNLGPTKVGFSYNNSVDGTLVAQVTVDGVPWYQPDFAPIAYMSGSLGVVDITGVGIYKGNFTWSMEYPSVPSTAGNFNSCLQVPPNGECQDLFFKGQGTYTLFVTPNTFPGPGKFQGEALLTFNAPEPSTASLLLMALAGLGFQATRARCAPRYASPRGYQHSG